MCCRTSAAVRGPSDGGPVMRRTTGRSRRAGLVSIGCVALAVSSGVLAVDGRAATPPTATTDSAAAASPTLGPLVAGTSSYIDGTYVWTDYAYDDRGPDTTRRQVVT